MSESTASPLRRLNAVDIARISTHAEFLRLRIPSSIVEGHGETKGQYTLGAIQELVKHLRSTGILLVYAEGLEQLGKTLASRAPDRDGDIILSKDDATELDDISTSFSDAWMNFLIENNFFDTRPTQGIFDYSKLDRAGGSKVLFQDSEILKRLPEDVTTDMNRATRALTRGVVTGSVLLGLRSGEAMVRHTFQTQLKKEPRPNASWFDLADEIFPALSIPEQAKGELEGFVNGLRITRNKAMHPGSTFGVRDAEDIILAVRQLVVRLDALPRPT